MEIWDAYDVDGNRLEEKLVRGEAIARGHYHLVSEVLVKHRDGSYLLVQRSSLKLTDPLKHEASAGGSCLAGESAITGALRELFEETGIDSIISIEPINDSTDSNTHYKNFLVITDCDKNSLTLQETEAISYQWLELESFKVFINSDSAIRSAIHRIKPFLDTL